MIELKVVNKDEKTSVNLNMDYADMNEVIASIYSLLKPFKDHSSREVIFAMAMVNLDIDELDGNDEEESEAVFINKDIFEMMKNFKEESKTDKE